MDKAAAMDALPDFGASRLAQAVERLTPEQVDALPFGAIRLDAEWRVTSYNATERRLSGLRREAIGRPVFVEIAPCMDNADFRGRIERAMEAGRLDIAFGYVADLPSGARRVAGRARAIGVRGRLLDVLAAGGLKGPGRARPRADRPFPPVAA